MATATKGTAAERVYTIQPFPYPANINPASVIDDLSSAVFKVGSNVTSDFNAISGAAVNMAGTLENSVIGAVKAFNDYEAASQAQAIANLGAAANALISPITTPAVKITENLKAAATAGQTTAAKITDAITATEAGALDIGKIVLVGLAVVAVIYVMRR